MAGNQKKQGKPAKGKGKKQVRKADKKLVCVIGVSVVILLMLCTLFIYALVNSVSRNVSAENHYQIEKQDEVGIAEQEEIK